MKTLTIVICFILFFSFFAVSICTHTHHSQTFGHNKDQCQSKYAFQESKNLRQEPIVLIQPNLSRLNFKFLKSFSLFELNSDNIFLFKGQLSDFDTISDFWQKSNQLNQLLAVVMIE